MSQDARHIRPRKAHKERICVVCGCTDSQACPGGCSWAIKHKDANTGVCSRCFGKGILL
jgi:hypothetical protein